MAFTHAILADMPPADTLAPVHTDTGYVERIAFVVDLAERLHAYGTTAQRLEGAVEGVAARTGLICEI